MVDSGLSYRDRVNASHAPVIRNVDGCINRWKPAEPFHGIDRQDSLQHVIDVVRSEAASEIIEDQSKPSARMVGATDPPLERVPGKICVRQSQRLGSTMW